MSYILEALRRAEAERERGLVPGLHARSSAAPDVAGVPGATRLRAWAPWAVAAVSVLVAVGLAWTWRAGPGDQPATVAVTPGVVPAISPPQTATTDTAPTGPSFAPTGVPSTVPAVPPTSMVAPSPTTRPAAVAARPSGPASIAIAAVPATAPPTTSLPAATATDAASAAADHRVYTLAELPEATRRELPALSIAGASYSEHPANRLLIVNGNVFHEGDRLAPDLVLERIDLKSAVLHYKDVRYSVSY